MIIVIDVGNTNITFGIYDGEALVGTFRMITKQLRTSDEYGVEIPEEELESIQTVGDIIEFMKSKGVEG